MAVDWDEALFISAYESRDGLNYDRRWLFDTLSAKNASAFVNILGLGLASRVVLVGAGFNWTCEHLEPLVEKCVGTDTSPWIFLARNDGNPGHVSNGTLLNEDHRNNGSRNAVKREFVGNADPTHVITEDVLSSLSDQEIADIADLRQYTNAVIAHLVTPLDPNHPEQLVNLPSLNWKTMLEWRALLDANGGAGDILIQAGTYEVF